MRLWWRHAQQGATVTVLLVLVVAIGAALLTATPRLQRHLFAEETASQIASLAETSRALTATSNTHFPWNIYVNATAAERAEAAAAIAAQAGPTLGKVMEPGQFSVEAIEEVFWQFDNETPSGLARRVLAPLVDSELLDRVRYVAGAAPAPYTGDLFHNIVFTNDEPPELEPAEIAISTTTAEVFSLDVGSVLEHGSYYAGHSGAMRVVVSGIFEPLDPADVVWQRHIRALRPYLKDDPDAGVIAFGVVVTDPTSPTWLAMLPVQDWQFVVSYNLSQQPVDTADLARDLRAFTSDRYSFVEDDAFLPLKFESRLAGVLDRALAVRDATAGALWVLLVGPIGGALAVCVLATLLSRARRTDALTLLGARGASLAQLRIMSGITGLVYGICAAAIGAGVAIAVTPSGTEASGGGFIWADLIGAVVFALAPGIALALAPLPRVGPARTRGRGPGRLRIVGEVAVLALTGAAVYTATNRGLTGAGLDPLTIAVPVLVAASVAVVGVRLLPLALGALHAATRRGRGLTAFLGSARAITQVGWPVFTLILAVGVATFSTTLFTTLDAGARTAAYSGVGADLRLSSGRITPDQQAELAEIGGIAAQAGLEVIDRTWISSGSEKERLTVIGVDVAALAKVQEGVPGANDLSALLVEPAGGRVPVFASAKIRLEGDLALKLAGDVPIDIVARPPRVLGVADTGAWVIADTAALAAAGVGSMPTPETILFRLDEGADLAAIEEAIDAIVAPTTFTTPAEALDTFNASPSVAGLRIAGVAAFGLATVFAALAVVLLLALRGPSRTYLVGIVRTLGGRLGAGLVSWEAIPAVVVGLIGGIGVGWYLPRFLNTVTDLRAFTGGAEAPPIVVSPVLSAAPVAVISVVLAVAIASAGALAARRMQHVLRIGE